MRREHLATLAAIQPIARHARGIVPDPGLGTCTEDVAGALQVDLLHASVLGWEAVAGSAWRSLRYLAEAFVEQRGRFRNQRDADGTWLEDAGSEDAGSEEAHGRAVLALGDAVRLAPSRPYREAAMALLQRALPGTGSLATLRATASAVVGCEAARVAGFPGTSAVQRRLTASLAHQLEPVAWSLDWPWPEPVLGAETALPPRALIIAGRRVGDRRMVEMGLAVLDWLMGTAVSPHGHLSPVGSDGWWPRTGPRAAFDQRPIEATSLLLAAEAAFEATGNPRYLDDMERAYAWFLGANDLGLEIADPGRGGCRDALRRDGCSPDEGAEATLAWLIALERIRVVRRRRSAATPRDGAGGQAPGEPPNASAVINRLTASSRSRAS